MPGPLPELVVEIQSAADAASQLHPEAVSTLIDPLPPAAATLTVSGETVYPHEPAAGCEIVKASPPIVTVAERPDVPVFAATAYATVPLPLPVAPEVIVTQALGVVALHAQPPGAVTVIVPLPPVAATACEVGVIVVSHDMAVCVTVNVFPAIVSVPVRDDVEVLAAALNETDPLPESDAPAVTVSQSSLLTAVHAQPDGAVTATVPVPPFAVTLCDLGEIVSVQPPLDISSTPFGRFAMSAPMSRPSVAASRNGLELTRR